MRIKRAGLFVCLSFFSVLAWADLEPYKDYDVSDAVWSVTTVKVDSNMGDAYLEGIEKTWAAGNKVAKELGHIEDWAIYRSQLPESGHFNLLLVVKYPNSEALAPSQERYNEFMAKWGEENAQESTDYAQKNYPGMRKITGEYMLREITFK